MTGLNLQDMITHDIVETGLLRIWVTIMDSVIKIIYQFIGIRAH